MSRFEDMTRLGVRQLALPINRVVTVHRKTQYGWSESNLTFRDGTRSGEVELRVDVESLIKQLAAKALRSKGGKAQMGGGAVVVRVRSRSDSAEGRVETIVPEGCTLGKYPRETLP